MEIYTYGNPDAERWLFQMVDEHDMEGMEQEVSYIRELTGGKDFFLKAIKVDDWNRDLSPWQAPAVFGKEDFGEGAEETLKFLLGEIGRDLPGECIEDLAADASAGVPVKVSAKGSEEVSKGKNEDAPRAAGRKLYLGGYSLAGLFALWAAYRTDCFDGIAAASPSVWFPGFTEYMKEHAIRTPAVYLSLGDREEKTRNPVMAEVGNAIREGYALLSDAGKDCILEWNKGNHFKEPDLRTAKAFAWLINRE